MTLFKSVLEKRYWLYALVTLLTILLTLVIGNPLRELLGNQDLRAVYFVLGMLLVGITILIHGIMKRPHKLELTIWFGFAALYLMFFLRLGLAERSHLIEYSVLAIFVHKALLERYKSQKRLIPTLLAIAITFTIGIIDETLQLFIPDRYFDALDIVFNGFVILMAIGGSEILRWLLKKFEIK